MDYSFGDPTYCHNHSSDDNIQRYGSQCQYLAGHFHHYGCSVLCVVCKVHISNYESQNNRRSRERVEETQLGLACFQAFLCQNGRNNRNELLLVEIASIDHSPNYTTGLISYMHAKSFPTTFPQRTAPERFRHGRRNKTGPNNYNRSHEPYSWHRDIQNKTRLGYLEEFRFRVPADRTFLRRFILNRVSAHTAHIIINFRQLAFFLNRFRASKQAYPRKHLKALTHATGKHLDFLLDTFASNPIVSTIAATKVLTIVQALSEHTLSETSVHARS